MSLALSRKWRPPHFDDVVGQAHVTGTLRNAIIAGRAGHAYLFCGPRGTGKTTTARLVAKAVNCLAEDVTARPCNECHICRGINEGRFLDLIEIDAASNTGVDDIRDLRDKINFSPSEGRFKVYIIDEVHMLSTAAFNALLKTLEEPPPHALFVLATTEEHKVPLTIKSRCQQFNFRLLTTPEIVSRLEWLVAQEDLAVEPAALEMIARQGAGSVRDAESLLDQLVGAPGDTITLERAQMVLGTAPSTAVHALAEAWRRGDGPGGLAIIHEALSTGVDARQFCRQMVTYLRQLLLLHTAGRELTLDVPSEQAEAMHAQAQAVDRAPLIDAIKAFNEAAVTPANTWQPQLPLELAFLDQLAAPARGAPAKSPPPPAKQPAAEPERPARPSAPPEAPPPSEPVASAGPAAVESDDARPDDAAPAAAPEAPAAGEPVAISPAADGVLTLDLVTGRWQTLLVRVAQVDRNLPALLTMSKPLAVEPNNTLVLGFDYPIFKEKFDNHAQAGGIVAAALKEATGLPCVVRAVAGSSYVPPVAKDEFEALADELGGVVRDSRG